MLTRMEWQWLATLLKRGLSSVRLARKMRRYKGGVGCGAFRDAQNLCVSTEWDGETLRGVDLRNQVNVGQRGAKTKTVFLNANQTFNGVETIADPTSNPIRDLVLRGLKSRSKIIKGPKL